VLAHSRRILCKRSGFHDSPWPACWRCSSHSYSWPGRSPLCLGADDSAALAVRFSGEAPAVCQKKHCLECHGEKEPKADLSLASEIAIAKSAHHPARVVWENILDMVETGQMPPKEQPEARSRRSRPRFVGLVQGSVLTTPIGMRKPDPGRVTVRRLNRVEYNNTIRDLIGIDFKPGLEDFPFGRTLAMGFDNIGDVVDAVARC